MLNHTWKIKNLIPDEYEGYIFFNSIVYQQHVLRVQCLHIFQWCVCQDLAGYLRNINVRYFLLEVFRGGFKQTYFLVMSQSEVIQDSFLLSQLLVRGECENEKYR